MRVIFLGTPEFARPTLERLIGWPGASVVAVVTQPDRPSGRGKKTMPPPTKVVAAAHGIPVLQPEKLSKAPETVQAMRDLKPDVLVMVAFGQILRKPVLEMAPYGVVNAHGSLLPRLRGAAPINWAIINGETTTGITTMLSDAGVDTGPMLLSRAVPIGPDENAEELAAVLARVSADLMIETLDLMASGRLTPESQDESLATYAPLLTREMGQIDWRLEASTLHNLVRGLVPWPAARATFRGEPLKVLRSGLAPAGAPAPCGSLILAGANLAVSCGADGRQRLLLIEVQPQSRSRMPAADWARGVRLSAGERFLCPP